MRIWKRIALAVAAVMLLSTCVFAAGASITVEYTDDGRPVSGAAFCIYRVTEYPEDLSGPELAQTVYAQIMTTETAPAADGVTDETGVLVFHGLEDGLYLLVGTPHSVDGTVYVPEAYLLALEGEDVLTQPKFETRQESEGVDYRVMKIWEDGADKDRPLEVEVRLYRDGALYDTVLLSKDNDWQYRWEGLDAASEWTVSELVPEGYESRISRDGDTFLVTNTKKDEATEPSEGTTPSEGTEPTAPEENGPKLPQTGQLWWPVPVLAAAGLILFCLGWLRRKERDHEA